MNDARIARARLEGNVKGQRWLEAVHTLADRVRRRAARGVGECAESQSHSSITTHQHAKGHTWHKTFTPRTEPHRQSFHFDTEDTGPAYIHTRPETYQVPGTGTYATI